MTPYFFLLMYTAGVTMTLFRHPIYGLYTYLFTFYLSPNDAWWTSSIPDIRYLLVIAVITGISILQLPPENDRSPWYKTGAGRILILFVAYLWLQLLWVFDPERHMDGVIMYSKHLITFFLMYRLIDSYEKFRDVALVHIIGCAWFGYLALGAGGGRLESVGGGVAGANELSVHVMTGIMFGAILFLKLKDYRKWIAFFCLPLILNCLILTVSRGAFLALIAAGIVGYFMIPDKARRMYRLAAIGGIVLFSMLAHDDIIDRFTETYIAMTADEVELDTSASNRKIIFAANIEMAKDYPFGIGYKATALLSPMYMPEELMPKDGGGRAAHNTVAGTLAEFGFIGLLLYFLIIGWVVRTMYRIWKAPSTQSTDEARYFATCAGTSLIGIYIAGNFSNNIDLETQYWCLAMLAVAYEKFLAGQHEENNAVKVSTISHGCHRGSGKFSHKRRL